jgi:dTDP-4-dehydro-6-deoxy-alpha-D-glucopyranose 2,3-dehydratase
MKDTYQKELDFIISAIHGGVAVSTDDALKLIKKKNEEVYTKIQQIPLSKLTQWEMEYDNFSIRHKSGKFFSIDGINVKTNWGIVPEWDQPIINQPEIGFLGIIAKKIKGILHFLMQLKIEPGNINVVQLSPTLQATRSNYTRVHAGRSPLFLDYFNGNKSVRVLVDQLQSEQGARFLKKRNRNIIVEIDADDDLEEHDNFVWLTLKQIKDLMLHDNVVNMDTRTVISMISYGSYNETSLKLLTAFQRSSFHEADNISSSFIESVLSNENHYMQMCQIIQWITSLKFAYELNVRQIPLKNLRNWVYDGNTIRHEQEKYFSIIGVNVQIGNREVTSWDQPLMKSAQEGIIAFITKKIYGIYHFLVQAKLEAGNFDVFELAPTVQCLTGNYRTGFNEYAIPFLEEVLTADQSRIWYSARQSEEGGRFYKEQNLNMIIEAKDDFPIELPERYCWMTLNQLITFVAFNNYLNIAARSLLSAIRFC